MGTAISVSLTIAILAGCLALPNTDHATVALLMLGDVAGVTLLWGWVEAVAGAVAGTIGFTYYFLAPVGLNIINPEHKIALATFLILAIAIGNLAARSKRLSTQAQISAAVPDVTAAKIAGEKLRDLAAQLMTVQEEERRRIARELHDEFTTRLATLGIELGLLKQTGSGTGSGDLQQVVDRLQSQVFHLSDDLRLLSHSLHPSMLEYGDLSTTLEMYCRKFTDQHGIRADFTARDVPEDIPGAIAVALFRIAQESLRNVAVHSGATSVSVILSADNATKLSLCIIDDGKGFDITRTNARPGLGLLSINERARTIGAAITIDSAPGAGTRLTVEMPLTITHQNA